MEQQSRKYQVQLINGDNWIDVSAEKLLFYLLPCGLVRSYRMPNQTESEVVIKAPVQKEQE